MCARALPNQLPEKNVLMMFLSLVLYDYSFVIKKIERPEVEGRILGRHIP